MIKWLLYLTIAISAAILVFWMFNNRERKSSGDKKLFDFGKTSPKWQVTINKYLQDAYTNSQRIPYIKGWVLRIRTRIETLSVYDEFTLRREVMRIVFIIFSLLLSIVFIVLLIRPSWLIVFWIFLGLIFLSGVLVDFFVNRVEERLLKQLKEFTNRLRYFYQQTKMVDEAVYESIQHVGPEMKIQAERIHGILTSVNPDEELAKYEEVAPSRFLKMIAGLASLVKEQGDKIDEKKGSAFLRGLTSVNQELNTEILYRSKLSHQMKGLSGLALIPVFFALPIQKWAISTFPVMKTFYESRMGFLAEVLAYGVSLLAYLMIRKMREINEAKYQATTKRVKWEKWMLEKVIPLRWLTVGITPASFSKEFFKLKKLLKDANSPNKIEWLTLHRILLTVSAFVLLAGGFWFSHQREKNSALNTVVPSTLFAGNITEEDYKFFEEQTNFDRMVIEDISNMEILTPEILQSYIAEQLGIDEVHDMKVKIYYERIVDKLMIVQNSFLKWWEILIAIFIAAILWYVPVGLLRFQSSLRAKDMENEVHQYLVLIGILREFDRMSVYMILSWMERFAVVFKDPLTASLQIYDSGPEEALSELSEQVSFEPFSQIVERLKLALVRISIKASFDDIEMEREFYLEQRKEANERSLQSKKSWSNLLGMVPGLVLIFLYLIVPLIYLSVMDSQEMLQRIQ